ncbi:hypothetical protein EY643_14520 [Halioglobus maricola]|uniref:Uncharacterized protein n=1 Tax=Halioglobus maricola TaxID=2601894 RepID=A0A5P9NMB1_9GAMM|nr:SdrD B-like domain-containing protein [Halioglobus maricola]QFU76769.1 hypothetical protein EY643_14520 [Halioglobus maricola]
MKFRNIIRNIGRRIPSNTSFRAVVALASLAMSQGVLAQATNADFSVNVNPGATTPNSILVYPGEATSLRVTLSNGSATPITGVNFSKALPTNALNGLLVNGPASIVDEGECGGVLTTTPGNPDISLAGLTIPALGLCYLDIPIVAYSVDGESSTLVYSLLRGEVDSDQGANNTGGPQGITLQSADQPEWEKSFVGDDVVIVGGALKTLRFTLHNRDSTVSLNNIGFLDIFPTAGSDGAIIEPAGTPVGGTCGGTVDLTTGAAAQVAVSGINLAPDTSCTIDVEVRARHSDGVYTRSRTNTISTDTFTSDEGLAPASDASQRVRARSPLAVRKRFNPGVVASGEENTFTITLTNSGSADLTVDGFTDNPISAAPYVGNLLIGSSADIANSCGGSTSLESGGEGFNVAGFDIPGGGECVIRVAYTGTTPGADTPTTYTNEIPAGAVDTVDGVVSQAQSATVLVADRLRVLKQVSPEDASPGDPVNYEVEIQNYSTSVLSDVDVTDSLQNGSTLLLSGGFAPTLSPACGALDLNGASPGASSFTFTIPTVPGRSAATNTPGTCTISFWAMLDPDGSGDTENEIAAGDVCYGTVPRICNNVGSGSTEVNPLDTMTVLKQFDGEDSVAVNEGTPSRVSFTVANRSVSSLSSLTLSDTLPSAGAFQQLRVASPANISNTCGGSVTAVSGSTSIALNGGTVPAYDGSDPGTCMVAVDVVGPAGEYPNTVNSSAVRQNANGTTTILNESDDATLTYTDALAVSKLFLPDSAGSGGRSTVSIELVSLDASRPITGVAFTDDLPAGMLVADPDNSYTTCNGPTVIDAVPGNSSVAFSGATLAPLASCELRFDVIATGTENWVNEIPAGGVTADGGLLNRNPISATLNYIPLEVPLISKSIEPGVAVPGESSLLTIEIRNADQDLTNVQVTDYFTMDGTTGTLPNGMRIAAAPEATTTCPGGIVSAAPGSQSVGLSGASLAADASCTVQVRVTSTTVGTITNTIPENSIESDQGATNSSSFAQSNLSTTSDAGISKTFTPSVVGPNEISTLRITIFNARAESITAMELVDQFPSGLLVADEPNAFSNCGGGALVDFPDAASVRLSGGSIGPAQGAEAASCYLEVDVYSTVEDSYLNVIEADSLTSNGLTVPHPETTARLEVRQRLIVTKAFDDLTLDADDPFDFTTGVAARLPGADAPLTIRLENPNTGTLTEVNFVDSLPDGLVLADVPDIATTCIDGLVTGVAAGRELRLTGATLPPAGETGAICTVTANVVSNIPGTYINEIAEGEVTSFEGINNLPGTQAQIVVAEPPAVSKGFAPPVVAPDVASTLTIVIGNDNEAEMTLEADLVDNLPGDPAQMVVADPANITTSCPDGTGIVDADAGESVITIASGTVVPEGGCVVSVDVTAPEAGDYLNSIPVGALVTNFGTNLAPANGPLKVSTLGYISGKVFLDNQLVPDGTYLAGDSTPIPGNVIELRTGADCSGALLDSTLTDDQGNYLFSELAADTYSVCQPTQPDDTLNSVTTPGTIETYAGSGGTPGVASNPVSGSPTSQVAEIILTDSGDAAEVSGSPDNNFSEVLPVSISGNVYFDANDDGVFDPGEAGIEGVTITLTGPVNLVVVTGPDGSYSFEGLPPGEYTVTETHPEDWTDGQDTAGTVDGVSRGDDSVDDVISVIVLAPGEDSVDNNFGENLSAVDLLVSSASACIQNAAYIDYELLNYDGSDVTVELLSTEGRLVQRLQNQPSTGTVLWPGMVVDAFDNGVGWPGWIEEDGVWSEVPDDRVPELVLRLSVNPEVEVTLGYPPATPACLTQPPGTLPAPSPAPAPGSPTTTDTNTPQAIPVGPQGMVWLIAMLLMAAGGRRLNSARGSAAR